MSGPRPNLLAFITEGVRSMTAEEREACNKAIADEFQPIHAKCEAEIAKLKHGLGCQRTKVEAAHRYFHEWAMANPTERPAHKSDETDPAALMRLIIGWYEARLDKRDHVGCDCVCPPVKP